MSVFQHRLSIRYSIVIVLAFVLFLPACAVPVQASTHEAMAPSIAAQYDANGNGIIDKAEAVAAITDYIFGEGDHAITKAQVIEIITFYIFGTPIPAQAAPPSLGDVVERVRPAVVKIVNDVAYAQGSGVLFQTEDENGYVITNQHVVRNAETVTVTVDDDTNYTGTVVGADADRDLAVVRICCNVDFPTADFGDSVDLRVGDEVFAVGYPLDQHIPKEQQAEPKVIVAPGVVTATVTRGIVSAFRHDSKMGVDLVQTDAPINPGNSGGPLFSMNGTIMGINTSVLLDTEGLNFAILETTVQERIPHLLAGGVPPPADDPQPQYEFVPSFGPWPGHIHHNTHNASMEVVSTDAHGTNVGTGARFINPYDAAVNAFSYGFLLRVNRTDPSSALFAFIVHSDGDWTIRRRSGGASQVVASGPLTNLRAGAGQYNDLLVAAVGEYGALSVNNKAVTGPDGNVLVPLGPHVHAGEVWIVTGYFVDTEVAGAITHFEDFFGEELVVYYNLSDTGKTLDMLEEMAAGRSRNATPGNFDLHAAQP